MVSSRPLSGRLAKEPGFSRLFGLSGGLETTKLLWFVLTPLWMYQASHSAADVALVPLADMMAMGLAGLVGGSLADRAPRTLLWASVAGIAGLALAGGVWAHAAPMPVAAILAWTFLLYGGFRLASLARTVLTNRLFRHRLVDINSAVGFVHSLAKVLGPLLAGALALFLSIPAAMLLTLAAATGLAALARGLAADPPSAPTRTRRAESPRVWAYLRKRPALFAGVGYFTLWMLSAGVYASVFYVFLLRMVHAAPSTYPLVMALQGAGNLAAAGWVPALNRRWPSATLVGAATLAVLLAEASYFLWPRLPLILILTPVVGAATQVGMVSVRAAFQRGADSSWVGRTLGARASVANLVAMAGSLAAAVAVRTVSTQALLLMGLVPLGAAAIVSRAIVPGAVDPPRAPAGSAAAQPGPGAR